MMFIGTIISSEVGILKLLGHNIFDFLTNEASIMNLISLIVGVLSQEFLDTLWLMLRNLSLQSLPI